MSETASVPEIDIQETRRRVENGALLLDVREQNEFDEARIPGSRLLPLSQFMQRYDQELPKDREIVVYCRSGSRSAQAAEFLIDQGYQAVNARGGILAWQQADLPIEAGKDKA